MKGSHTIALAVLTVSTALMILVRSGVLTQLGGAKRELLERAAVDTPAFTSRGIAAIIPALFGTFAMTVALGDGQQLELQAALAGGIVWGLIVRFFDLSIMSVNVSGGSIWSRVRCWIFVALRAAERRGCGRTTPDAAIPRAHVPQGRP